MATERPRERKRRANALKGVLEVLPSGPMPPDPGEFVGTQKVSEILAWLRDRADFVLVDAPPVLQVGDAVTLRRRSTGSSSSPPAASSAASPSASSTATLGCSHPGSASSSREPTRKRATATATATPTATRTRARTRPSEKAEHARSET